MGARFTGESCRCTSRQRKSPFFRKLWEIWTLAVVNLVVLANLLKTTTEKSLSTFSFSGKKSAPHRENSVYSTTTGKTGQKLPQDTVVIQLGLSSIFPHFCG